MPSNNPNRLGAWGSEGGRFEGGRTSSLAIARRNGPARRVSNDLAMLPSRRHKIRTLLVKDERVTESLWPSALLCTRAIRSTPVFIEMGSFCGPLGTHTQQAVLHRCLFLNPTQRACLWRHDRHTYLEP